MTEADEFRDAPLETLDGGDVEIELPPWKGPKAIRVKAIVRSVSKGTFRPITEDDIMGY